MKRMIRKLTNNSGFTLVEVIISMFILSIVAAATLMALVFALRISRVNQYEMTAMNLANDRVEYIRSLSFAEVGTKSVVGGSIIYGDPKGEIPETETIIVDGVTYAIKTTIAWEDQSGWDLKSMDWDYKSVLVDVIPQVRGDENLAKKVETLVTRDSTQPLLLGANIGIRMIRGWKLNAETEEEVPVPYVKISLKAGPSAPRQVQTSTEGISRFINLGIGTYKVNIDPSSAGMILRPDQAAEIEIKLTEGMTEAKDVEAEAPCYLKLALKSLEGSPINLALGKTGTIKVDLPYGTDISKSFSSVDLTSQGCLPQDFLGSLWPVGIGYPGAYTVSDLSIPGYIYFGAYEEGSTGKELWPGTFPGPGSVKEITCYFKAVPSTPSDIDANWASSTGDIKTGTNLADQAVFSTSNKNNSIVLKASNSPKFSANGIYFENTGSAGKPGLIINNKSILSLNSGLIVFRGKVQIVDATKTTDRGSIRLGTVFTDGTQAHTVPGSEIGGTARKDKLYSKLYLVEPMVLGSQTMLNPGGYYFYDGLKLPDNLSELIPITRENYID